MNSNGYSEEFDSMFKILLATDNHLGVHENDGVRGKYKDVTYCFLHTPHVSINSIPIVNNILFSIQLLMPERF